ncbi:MAG: hypothetical protein K1X86_03595 [Ignavibacteria bacterium]|nr:hypothetical protein [Ignavibacteria bacterium]
MDTPVTTAPVKKEKVIKGITCPACNGELDLKEGMKTFNCKYCGTLLAVKGESGPAKYFVPKTVKKDDAINRTFAWLEKGISKAKGLKANSKIDEAFLVYIPYWRVRADVVGWVFGQERKTRTVNNRTEVYYVDVERKIQQSFDRTFPACDVAELGVKQVNLTGDELLPVDFESLQQDGMMFNIVSSEKEVSEFAKGDFASYARASANVDRVTFEHYDLVRDDLNIVYYPLWVVRYVFQNRTYQAVVDGQDGTICYGKAPGNNLFRAVMGILGVGAGMYLATLFGAFSIAGESGKGALAAYVVALVLGIFIIKWGYKKFRYGGEIEEGTGIVEEREVKNVKSSSNEGMAMVKDVAASVAIGSVMDAVFRQMRR